jgi:hypothetical protein
VQEDVERLGELARNCTYRLEHIDGQRASLLRLLDRLEMASGELHSKAT